MSLVKNRRSQAEKIGYRLELKEIKGWKQKRQIFGGNSLKQTFKGKIFK